MCETCALVSAATCNPATFSPFSPYRNSHSASFWSFTLSLNCPLKGPSTGCLSSYASSPSEGQPFTQARIHSFIHSLHGPAQSFSTSAALHYCEPQMIRLFGNAGLWMHTVAELKSADQVHAVAVLPGCAPKSGQAAEGVIVAAVGRRLVAFGEQHGQLQKHHLTATAQPVTCLSPDGDTGDIPCILVCFWHAVRSVWYLTLKIQLTTLSSS